MAIGTWEDLVLARKRARRIRAERFRRTVDAVDEAVRAAEFVRQLEQRKYRDEVVLLHSGLRTPVYGL